MVTTITLPALLAGPVATQLAASEGCENQAFEYGASGSPKDRNVLALQFHLESSEASIQRLIDNCADDMAAGKYVQTQDEIFSQKVYLPEIRDHMESLLNEIGKRLVGKQRIRKDLR